MAAQIQGQELDYKPWGGLAGVMAGTREAETDAANLLALQESQLGNVVKQRDASVAQEQMNSPEWMKQKIAGEIGQNQSLAAGGKEASALVDSKIKTGLAEHIAKTSKAQIEQELNQVYQTSLGLDKLIAAGEATGYSGMQFEYGANEIAKQMGADPKMIQQFLKANPEGRATMLKALKESANKTLTYTPEVMRKMAEEEQKSKMHGQYITGPTNTTTLEAHKMDNASREKVAAMNAAQLKENTRAINDAKDENARTNLMNHLNGQQQKINTQIKEIEAEYQNIQPQMFRGEIVNGKPLTKDEVSKRVTAARAKLAKERADAVAHSKAIQKQLDDIFSKSKFATSPSMFPGDEDAMAADLAGQQPVLPPGVTIKR